MGVLVSRHHDGSTDVGRGYAAQAGRAKHVWTYVGEREKLRLMQDINIYAFLPPGIGGNRIERIYRIHFRVFLSESSLKLGQRARARATPKGRGFNK